MYAMDFITQTAPGAPLMAQDQMSRCASRAARRSLVVQIPALLDSLRGIGHRATYPAEEG